MKMINEDIFYNINKISTTILEEISEIDINAMSDDSKKEISKISKNTREIKDKDEEEFIVLMSKMDIFTMSNFFLNIEKNDKFFSNKIIKMINSNKGKNEKIDFVLNKLLGIYKMSLFSSVFSESRLQALELSLRNYE